MSDRPSSSKKNTTSRPARRYVPRGRKTSRVGGTRVVRQRDLAGYKYTPSAEIPESTPKPWYPLVVSKTLAPQLTTLALLVGYTIDQLDKDFVTFKKYTSQEGSLRIDIRLHKVEVWNLTGRAVSLSVWQPPPNDYSATTPGYTFDQLGGWTDAGGGDTFPRVGYVYPYAIQTQGHTADWTANSTPFNVITTTASNSKDTLLHRFHISWRSPGQVQYTTVIPYSPPDQDLIAKVHAVKSAIGEHIVNDDRLAEKQEGEVKQYVKEVVTDIDFLRRSNQRSASAIKKVCEAILQHMPSSSDEIVNSLTAIIDTFDLCDEDQL